MPLLVYSLAFTAPNQSKSNSTLCFLDLLLFISSLRPAHGRCCSSGNPSYRPHAVCRPAPSPVSDSPYTTFCLCRSYPVQASPLWSWTPPARLCLEGCLGHEAGVTEDMSSSRTISFETLASDSSSHGAR
jgi:hypothetical protein